MHPGYPRGWAKSTALALSLVVAGTLLAGTTATAAPDPAPAAARTAGAVPPWLPDYRTWIGDVTKATAPATGYLESVPIEPGEKPAIVLDIDNTSLETQYHFRLPDIPAIEPVQRLVEAAKDRGFGVFFITGRPEPLREATRNNLRAVGYPVDGLVLHPLPSAESLQMFKQHAREDLEHRGYTIVANIGNSAGDLAGDHAERTVKLPDYHGWLA
ncbi:HAD family acid phosphatase [Sciscionella marina]|uniref:HAD family acid phosphatase n=1 Tax=Sciscionella marina TaxID=508770 RepID=UPI0003805D6E|nr:HAD family acid phosphatase [Sciscionella marina]